MSELKTFIGIKTVEAKPMRLGEFGKLVGKMTPLEDDHREGYLVVYQPDGYKSWSPKEVFESAYFEFEKSNSVSQSDIDRFCGEFSSRQLDEKTTIVSCTAASGFVQHEVSSCVDPANYNHELGVDICTENIKGRMWPLLGFVMQWAKYGLKSSK